jgi:hypothetical protein
MSREIGDEPPTAGRNDRLIQPYADTIFKSDDILRRFKDVMQELRRPSGGESTVPREANEGPRNDGPRNDGSSDRGQKPDEGQ